MVSSRCLLVSFFWILLLINVTMIPQAVAQPPFIDHSCIDTQGSYTANSTYQKNLNSTLSSLTSDNNHNGYGFYNSFHGQNSDQVYSMGLCRGDVKAVACRSCLNDSRYALPQLCPTEKEAIGWYDICMLRYSDSSMHGVMETGPAFYSLNPNNVSASGLAGFNQKLKKLLENITIEAAGGGSLRKFAYGDIVAPSQTIFAIVQCTPDLSEQACTDCLVGAYGQIPNCCGGRTGARIIRPSCNIRYEGYRFIEPATIQSLPSSPPPPPSSVLSPPPPQPTNDTISGESKSNRSRTLIIIVVPIIVSLVLILSICICVRVRKTKNKFQISKLIPGEDAEDFSSAESSLQFDLDTIRVATNDFSEANKLGQGGFGPVYKGKFFNGKDIAVKRLSINSGQGDLEFKNEVLLVTKLQHRNLVRLLGFCLEGIERLLIYEFVPNASLDHIIFDPVKREQLDWNSRYKIIIGISRGLIYLHEDSRLRIIHRDLKASNILIDTEMNPKLSDFGMAKLFVVDQTQGNTSRIVGTYGYMAPEYVKHGHFSVKSDVFSFGVLVLEIISGQKISCFRHGENEEDLLSFAWKSWKEGTVSNLIDSTLRGGSRAQIMRCIHIGLLCVQENVTDRPTMNSIVLMLNSYSATIPAPLQPAFFLHSKFGSKMSSGSKNYSGVTMGLDRSKVPLEGEASMISEVYAR